MFSWPFGPYAWPFGPYGERWAACLEPIIKSHWYFQRAARAILNRGFAAEDLLINLIQTKSDRLLG
jgi:hypothetical protein